MAPSVSQCDGNRSRKPQGKAVLPPSTRTHTQPIMELLLVVWLLAAGTLVLLLFQPLQWWRLRKLPGPAGLPLIGNLHQIIFHGELTGWMDKQARKYGKVFKFWQGSVPMVVVSDPDFGRKLLAQNVDRPSFESLNVLVGENLQILQHNLLSMKGTSSRFRTFRRAFEAAVLNPAALASHTGVMSECATRLVRHLSKFAATGEPVDTAAIVPEMTMDVIGFAAFGLDFNCLREATPDTSLAATAILATAPDTATPVTAVAGSSAPAGEDAHPEDNPSKVLPKVVAPPATVTPSSVSGPWEAAPPGSAQFSEGLVNASRTIFRMTSVTQGSPWKRLGVLLPGLRPLISHLANWFPDDKLRRELQARSSLNQALRVLIREWQQHRAATAKMVPQAAELPPAISDRGFLARMLTAMEDGSLDFTITEIDIISQAVTMVLAGYETTASAISMALHLLSTHPEAQRRAQQEIDGVLRGRDATAADLDLLPFTRAVFDEALRLSPPAASVRLLRVDRTCESPDGSVVIPAGTFTWVNNFSFQRDPAIWGPTATEFRPERHIQPGNEHLTPTNPHALLPFGYGSRFAPLEGRLTLVKLLQAYTFEPAAGCPPPKMITGIVYTADHVWLSIRKRHMCHVVSGQLTSAAAALPA